MSPREQNKTKTSVKAVSSLSTPIRKHEDKIQKGCSGRVDKEALSPLSRSGSDERERPEEPRALCRRCGKENRWTPELRSQRVGR